MKLLDGIIADLTSAGHIDGAIVATRGGLPIVSKMSTNVNVGMLCAMAATMFSASETAAFELDGGMVDRVTIQTGNSAIITFAAGPNALLAVKTRADMELDSMQIEISEATRRIRELI